MPISTRYANNPSVRKSLQVAHATNVALHCETQTVINANFDSIAFLNRRLSAIELARIARFEKYILDHEPDILSPRLSREDGPSGPTCGACLSVHARVPHSEPCPTKVLVATG